MRRIIGAILGAALAASPMAPAHAAESTGFELVGSNPLHNRGMNAAPAMYDHTMYIGSRTDGSHPHAGVLIVDVADPANPTIVGEIGPPDEGLPSVTSRELRVWPEKKLLMVMNFQCSAIIHACVSPSEAAGSAIRNITFYDLTDRLKPVKVSTYTPTRTPHEMFLWTDPKRPGRALLYMSTPTSSATQPNLIVTDISKAREGTFTEIVRWVSNPLFPQGVQDSFDVRLHSVSVNIQGTRTYLAYLGGGFLVVDSSDVAKGVASPKLKLVTPVASRVPAATSVGTHTSVNIPGTNYALTTDEVYGRALTPAFGEHGCPWGWLRTIDISDEAKPKLVADFKLAQNKQSYCEGAEGQDPANTHFTSYAAHTPTLVGDLVFVTWHSAGLRAISVADPKHPVETGVFLPEPLAAVVTEDPALSLGKAKVVMWSYPIISHGLIYVVDLRNGLYVLRYTGDDAQRVRNVTFLEGNSTLGDAARLDGARVLGARQTRAPAKKVVERPLPSTGVHPLVWPGLALLGVAFALAGAVRRKAAR